MGVFRPFLNPINEWEDKTFFSHDFVENLMEINTIFTEWNLQSFMRYII